MAVHALANNRPLLLLLAEGVLPMLVDYQWAGVGSVLLAVPVVLLAARVQWQLPRWRWMFYGYYVGHLLVLAVVARVLS